MSWFSGNGTSDDNKAVEVETTNRSWSVINPRLGGSVVWDEDEEVIEMKWVEKS
jgi:hypothetical protein